MSDKDFKNLDQFLQSNRPAAPSAPANELQAIQERLGSVPARPFYYRPAIWASLGTAVAALLVFINLQRPAVVPASEDAGLIVYSAMVDFYDADESALIAEDLSEETGFDDSL